MMTVSSGFGVKAPKWVLHIQNRPTLDAFEPEQFRSLAIGEAAEVIKHTSNHWRKVFSIMAKISFALFQTGCTSWQEYRDSKLLTEQGFEAINYEVVNSKQSRPYFSVVSGFTYAEHQLDLTRFYPFERSEKLLLAPDMAVLVTPYFDWRQLNNALLAQVIEMMGRQLRL